MKINYIANARMPTEKAHGIQISKMCESFAAEGNDVNLLLPKRKNVISQDIFSYYGVGENFTVNRLWCLDTIRVSWLFGPFAYYIQAMSFALSIRVYLAKHKFSNCVYTRDATAIFFLSRKKFKIVLESHNFPNHVGSVYKWLLRKSSKHIAITKGLKNDLVKLGFKSDNIYVSPDAVDLESFDVNLDKIGARRQVDLPQDKKIVMYTGHLYKWKGVKTVLRAAKEFGDKTWFVFVGGTNKDIASFKNLAKNTNNVFVLGHVVHKNIPTYLAAADLLVLPNSGDSKVSRLYTSPMKLFEYMAAGRPIVASDLPSLREILSEETAEFFEADNSVSMARAIKKVLFSTDEGTEIAKNSKQEVKKYSWSKRVCNILEFIK